MRAWHFTDGMKLRDGTPLECRRYEYGGKVVMCESGYHWSRDPMDALMYAPGFTLSLVDVEDIVEERADKGVSRVRTVIEIHDVRDVVLLWAADVAEHAVRKYYTGDSDAPQKAIDTVRAHVRGEATQEDCRKAADAAYAVADAYAVAAAADAADAADAAYAAANAAANASYTADAAYAVADVALVASKAAYYAGNYTANAAAYAAAYATYATYATADAAAAARQLLRLRLREVFSELS